MAEFVMSLDYPKAKEKQLQLTNEFCGAMPTLGKILVKITDHIHRPKTNTHVQATAEHFAVSVQARAETE